MPVAPGVVLALEKDVFSRVIGSWSVVQGAEVGFLETSAEPQSIRARWGVIRDTAYEPGHKLRPPAESFEREVGRML